MSSVLENRKFQKSDQPDLTLLTMSLVSQSICEAEMDIGDKYEEVTTFDSKTDIDFVTAQLDYFNLCQHCWVVAFIDDRSNTNKKVANDSNKPRTGCISHKINLEVNLMLDCDTEIEENS